MHLGEGEVRDGNAARLEEGAQGAHPVRRIPEKDVVPVLFEGPAGRLADAHDQGAVRRGRHRAAFRFRKLKLKF